MHIFELLRCLSYAMCHSSQLLKINPFSLWLHAVHNGTPLQAAASQALRQMMQPQLGGYSKSWLVGKNTNFFMDDNWGYPHFRKGRHKELLDFTGKWTIDTLDSLEPCTMAWGSHREIWTLSDQKNTDFANNNSTAVYRPSCWVFGSSTTRRYCTNWESDSDPACIFFVWCSIARKDMGPFINGGWVGKSSK